MHILGSHRVLILLAAGTFAASVPAVGAEKTPDSTGSRNFQALAKLIDQEIQAKLADQKLTALSQADDAMFLRRLYLDLHGTLPPADRAAAFLDSKDAAKRSKLIDELLASEKYGQNLGDLWYQLLIPLFPQNKQKEKTTDFIPWMAKQFNDNRPWDKLTYDILTASGPVPAKNPEMHPLLNSNMVLAQEEAINMVSSAFLGANLKCAQCHKHPFADWTKKDYWGMASFFSKLVRTNTGIPSVRGLGEGNQQIKELPEGYVKVAPRFFDGVEPKFASDEPYRPTFAAWATSPKNAFFARCMVNRVWAQLFGRGIVNPLDDVRPDNDQCTHPELLQKLADAFIASGFDVKFLFRSICESQTYQRVSKPEKDSENSEKFYGRMPTRVLTPLQLTNALSSLSVQKEKGGDMVFMKRFISDGDEFDPLSYQRGLPQQLRLINSIALEGGRRDLARSLEATAKTPAEFVEQACLRILSRRPSVAESQKFTAYIQKTGASAHEDVVWVLLNLSEFTLIR